MHQLLFITKYNEQAMQPDVKLRFLVTAGSKLVYQFPGSHSKWEPPDSIPNSEVKTLSADDSVGLPM